MRVEALFTGWLASFQAQVGGCTQAPDAATLLYRRFDDHLDYFQPEKSNTSQASDQASFVSKWQEERQ